MAPNWITTRNIPQNDFDTFIGMISSNKIICPVELIGSHSVIPQQYHTISILKSRSYYPPYYRKSQEILATFLLFNDLFAVVFATRAHLVSKFIFTTIWTTSQRWFHQFVMCSTFCFTCL